MLDLDSLAPLPVPSSSSFNANRKMSSSSTLTSEGSPGHIISKGFQPPPPPRASVFSKPARTRKRLSMNFTSIPVVNSSDSTGSPALSPSATTQNGYFDRQPRRSASVSYTPGSFKGPAEFNTSVQSSRIPSASSNQSAYSSRSMSVASSHHNRSTSIATPSVALSSSPSPSSSEYPSTNPSISTSKDLHGNMNHINSLQSGSSASDSSNITPSAVQPPSGSLSNLNDALMNKSHRSLRSRSTSLTLSPHGSPSSDLNDQQPNSNIAGVEGFKSNISNDAASLPINFASISSSSSLSTITPDSSSSVETGIPSPSPSPALSVQLMSPSSSSTSATSVSSTTTNGNQAPTTAPVGHSHHQPSFSLSSNFSSGSAYPSAAASSAIEYYFSQLAYRERRIVELRDEIKRMQQKLKQAEDDLEDFKKQVPTRDIVRPDNTSNTIAVPLPSNTNSGLKRSVSQHNKRLVISHSPLTLVDNPSSNVTQGSRRSSYPMTAHVSNSSTSTTSSRHSNSPSDSSTSSMTSSILEEEEGNTTMTTLGSVSSSGTPRKSKNYINTTGDFGAGSSFVPTVSSGPGSTLSASKTHGLGFNQDGSNFDLEAASANNESAPNFDDEAYYSVGGVHTGLYDKHIPQGPGTTDQVLHLGKRVVEELGTQFWSFIEDIKNVATGDDARDPTGSFKPPQQIPGHSKSKSLAIGQPTNSGLSNLRGGTFEATSTFGIEMGAVSSSRQVTRSSSVRAKRLPESSMSMGNLHAVLMNDTEDTRTPPSSLPEGPLTLSSSPNLNPGVDISSKSNSLGPFNPNQPSVSVSSISTKGMASEMGSAVSRHRTRNSVSLGRSATVGGGFARRNAVKKTSENSYYMV